MKWNRQGLPSTPQNTCAVVAGGTQAGAPAGVYTRITPISSAHVHDTDIRYTTMNGREVGGTYAAG